MKYTKEFVLLGLTVICMSGCSGKEVEPSSSSVVITTEESGSQVGSLNGDAISEGEVLGNVLIESQNPDNEDNPAYNHVYSSLRLLTTDSSQEGVVTYMATTADGVFVGYMYSNDGDIFSEIYSGYSSIQSLGVNVTTSGSGHILIFEFVDLVTGNDIGSSSDDIDAYYNLNSTETSSLGVDAE